MSSDRVREIRSALNDPYNVCAALGLLGNPQGIQRQARGVIVRCLWHRDNTPSCSVFVGDDGTIRVHCHGCDKSGDILSLIAVVHHLDLQRDFPKVLRQAENLAGIAISESGSYRALPRSVPAPSRRAPESRDYPPLNEVETLWNSTGHVADDVEACAMLERRKLDIEILDQYYLARVISKGIVLPSWGRFHGQPWTETGHRLLLPAYDSNGCMRSLRAWRVTDHDTPKRLPPSGHKASGLMLADPYAVAMLQGLVAPQRVVIVEGEPDFLTWATTVSDADEEPPAILGVVNGSWTGAIAARIPDGAHVVIRTHHDGAGVRYAAKIGRSLIPRCTMERSKPIFAEGEGA